MKKINLLIFILCLIGIAGCGKEEGEKNDSCFLLEKIDTLYSNMPFALYRDLIFADDTTAYAISEGFVVKTTNGGKTWDSHTLPISTNVGKIQFTDKNTGYITGGDNTFGVLFKTIDGGGHWSTIHLNSLEIPSGMFFINNDTGFITGKGLFAKTTDGGENWTDLKDENVFMYNDVKFKNNKDGIVTSMNGIYFQTRDGGITWNKLKYNTIMHLYNIYYVDNTTYIDANSVLLDLENNKEIAIPGSNQKFVFFDSKKSVAVARYWEDVGCYPQGIIYATDSGWKTYCSKNFFNGSIIAKMSENKAMALCANLIIVINF